MAERGSELQHAVPKLQLKGFEVGGGKEGSGAGWWGLQAKDGRWSEER